MTPLVINPPPEEEQVSPSDIVSCTATPSPAVNHAIGIWGLLVKIRPTYQSEAGIFLLDPV